MADSYTRVFLRFYVPLKFQEDKVNLFSFRITNRILKSKFLSEILILNFRI